MEISRISSFFLEPPPRILCGFMWRLQKEPPISNSKIFFQIYMSYTSQVRSWNVHVCISYHSKITLQTHGGSFICHKKNDANSSMQRLQSYVCHSPKKKKINVTHMCTQAPSMYQWKVRSKLCMIHHVLCYNTWWQKTMLHAIYWVCHVHGGRGQKNISCLNLMAGTLCKNIEIWYFN